MGDLTNNLQMDVGDVARLARLELDEPTKDKFQKEMAAILDYINLLEKLDVSGIEPTAHAAPMSNVLRDDQAKATVPREVMLANAPKTVDEELLKVPQVISGEEGA